MIGLLRIEAEITVVCEKVCAGCEFRALFYDKATEQFYGGSGATALEAVAWCLDEYIRRGVLQLGPAQARRGDERPGDCASAPPAPSSTSSTSITPSPVAIDGPALAAVESVKDASGCFVSRIPTTPAPRLHGEAQRDLNPAKTTRTAGGRR